MSRRLAPVAIPLIVAALMAASCSRSVTLGSEEAVEVMVLDGVGRGQAECIVASLDGQLDLAKITGLDVNLTETELSQLAQTSGRCAPTLAGSSGIVSEGQTLEEAFIDQENAILNGEIDVGDAVLEMVAEGLEAAIGDCLVVELSVRTDAAEVVGDIIELSRLIADCRQDVERAQS